jgi:flagellum-specific peptidoglycan hydrolase FlgJ
MKDILYHFLLFWILDPNTQTEYCKKYYPIALYCEYVYGIPVSVQLAQALYESNGGRSYIGSNSNNHFGIRYYKTEYNGKYFTDRKNNKWRRYDSVTEGYIDHAKFLSKHYSNLKYKNYKSWSKAKGYGESGYWVRITKIIEQKKLNKLDYYDN